MAKGQEAKDKVIAVLQEAFGDSFLGIVDKKVYLLSEENGEATQVCLAMTCPKTPIDTGVVGTPIKAGTVLQCKTDPDGKMTDYTGIKGPIPQGGAFEISDEESEKVADLLKELNIQ